MTQSILYLFTRTPLHVGAGSSVGAIDQPVQRERHTGFPIVPGTAIKGVLADGYLEANNRKQRTADGRKLFGHENPESDCATSGSLSFSEAKLLAFPVRSAKGCFAWVTSPLILQRWICATGKSVTFLENAVTGMQIYGDAATLADGGTVVLEDYAFTHHEAFAPGNDLPAAIPDALWRSLCAQHLVLISDDMMAHFARNACEVAQHVSIDDETGAADGGKLFNQENVPADTLFYSVVSELRENALAGFSVPSVLQIGGDATTGLGFCTTHLEPVSSPSIKP